MRACDIYDGITQIRDDLIEEAGVHTFAKRPIYRRAGAVAAAVVLTAGIAAAVVGIWLHSDRGIRTENDTVPPYTVANEDSEQPTTPGGADDTKVPSDLSRPAYGSSMNLVTQTSFDAWFTPVPHADIAQIASLPVFIDRYPTGQAGPEYEVDDEYIAMLKDRITSVYELVSGSAPDELEPNAEQLKHGVYLCRLDGAEYISNAYGLNLVYVTDIYADVDVGSILDIAMGDEHFTAALEFLGLDPARLAVYREEWLALDGSPYFTEYRVYEQSDTEAETLVNRSCRYISIRPSDYDLTDASTDGEEPGGTPSVSVSIVSYDALERAGNYGLVPYETALEEMKQLRGDDEPVVEAVDIIYRRNLEKGYIIPCYCFYLNLGQTDSGYTTFESYLVPAVDVTSPPVEESSKLPDTTLVGKGRGYTDCYICASVDDVRTWATEIDPDTVNSLETLPVFKYKYPYGHDIADNIEEELRGQAEEFLALAGRQDLVDFGLDPSREWLEDEYDPSFRCNYPEFSINVTESGISLVLRGVPEIASADIAGMEKLLTEDLMLAAACRYTGITDPVISIEDNYNFDGDLFNRIYKIYQNSSDYTERICNKALKSVFISVAPESGPFVSSEDAMVGMKRDGIADYVEDYPVLGYDEALARLEQEYGVTEEDILFCEIRYDDLTTDQEYYLPYYHFYFDNTEYEKATASESHEWVNSDLIAICDVQMLAVRDWE